MKINKLLNCKFVNNHIVSIITDNSKECIENSVFILNKKNQTFLDEAINNGTKTVISEFAINLPDNINSLIVKNIKKFQSKILSKFYKNIIKKYTVIGITGTNGKTSTCNYLYQYLRMLNEDVLLISSNGIFLDDLKFETQNTTPDIFTIYKYAKKNLIKNKFKKQKKKNHYLILECSSQGIRNLRVKYIPFDIVLFTNITSDHLDYHKDLSDYFFSKCLLLNNLKPKGIVICNNDHCDHILIDEICNTSCFTFGSTGDVSYKIISTSLSNTIFELTDNNHTMLLETPILSGYQIENLIGVYSLIKYLNLDTAYYKAFIQKIKPISGRLNVYNIKNRTIVIDYAHTFIATKSVINFIKQNTNNNIFVVVGCGGNRDKTKRSKIGKFTTTNADFVVFTEDNNRLESFDEIIKDIISNIDTDNYKVIQSRYDAISYAISNMKESDILLILGKGTERTIVESNFMTDYEMALKIIND